MGSSGIPATTLLYLFAELWAPASDGRDTDAEPVLGAVVKGLDTAANLLNAGIWNLWRQGWITVEQLRPAEPIRTLVLGGASFVRAAPRKVENKPAPRGLEGFLWRAISDHADGEGRLEALVRRGSGDDRHGLRSALIGTALSRRRPSSAVFALCRGDAADRGLIEVRGRWRKRLAVPDLDAVRALRPEYEEVSAARRAHLAEHAEFDHAVLGDCFAALIAARSSTS
ncbi:hypothetical protein ABTW95_19020 [Spirillospora sp. NPDC127506]